MNLLDKSKEELVLEIQELQQKYNSLKKQLEVNSVEDPMPNNYIKLVLDNFPIGIATNEIDSSKVTYMNQKFSEIYGWPEDELPDVGSFFEKVFPNLEYRQQIQTRIMEDISSGDIKRMKWDDLKITTKAGNKKVVYAFNIPLFDQNIMVSTVQDLTERFHVEEKLQISETKFKAVAELSPLAIYASTGSNQKGIYINKTFVNIFGYTLDDLPTVGDWWVKAFPDEKYRQQVIEQWTSNIELANKHNIDVAALECVCVCKDGSEKTIAWVGKTIGDEFWAYGYDNTDSKKAEFLLKEKNEEIEVQNEEYLQINEELNQTNAELQKAKENAEENEKHLRKIIDHSPLPMVIAVDNKYVEFVNKKFTELYGYTQEDIPTDEDYFGKAYPDEDYRNQVLTSWLGSIEIAIKNNTDVEPHSYTITTKNGNKREVEFYMVLIGNKAVIVANDVTERKKFEDQLIIAKEKAEESDRLKTAFLQNMSHEIRTPMNAIMGFSDLLCENFDDKAKLKLFSNIISQRCYDLLNIVNDILDISKIESGQLSVNIENCNLNLLFKELSSFFYEYQNRINKQHIKFYLRTEPTENLILVDTVKLKQILINLISNAFKFTEDGRIEVGCKIDKNQKLICYVSDTGIGIPADKHEVIFERFFQLPQDSRMNVGGTGLGLTITKGLVNLLGGNISLESEPGKGSVFSFSIPFTTPQALQPKHEFVKNREPIKFPNKNILIVEDDIYNTAYLKEILSKFDLNILHAENGRKAIDVAISQPIDLVLMDIRLPDINGYEATRQILKHKPRLKIIAQTAYASHDEKDKAFNAGCIDYISKPTKQDVVLSMLCKQLT